MEGLLGPGRTEVDVSSIDKRGEDDDEDDGVLPVSVVGDYVAVTIVVGSVRGIGGDEGRQATFAPGSPFVVVAGVEGKADEGGEVEEEDCEA